jgi:hypothetical protein
VSHFEVEFAISYAGIAIFVFGNKIYNGNVVIADGLIKEFEIAKKNGLLLIPIGATGYATKVIYDELSKEGYFDADEFPQELRGHIKRLADLNSDLETIKSVLIDFLNSLK